MKKDDKLERAFDEYFEGMELPENLTEDAKKLNTKRKPLWARLTKYASALACVLIVCIVAVVGIYSGVNYIVNDQDSNDYSSGSSSSGSAGEPSTGDSSGSSSDGDSTGDVSDGGDSVLYDTYALSSLEASELDAYTISETNSALAIIQDFAYASNASVTSCTGYSEYGELLLVKAEVTVTSTYNQQTVIYVEFTGESYICEELTDYYDGATYAYGNISYLYYETEDNGEPVRCITAAVNGVKYYIRVTSTDTEAYLEYLELLSKL